MEPEDVTSDLSSDEAATPRLTESHRQRAQNASFTALLEEHVINTPSNSPNGEHVEVSDAELSTARLLAKTEPGGGVLDPREYQIELFERARASNTIAVLDTGSGKTLVAVLLLKHILQMELNKRAHGTKPRVAFFLVDTVTLVFQQSAVLRNNLDQKVAHFFGNLGPDLWDKQTWDKHLEKYMVIVCTAEILNQSLLNGHIRIDQINLLIFDEAHHAKKEHPFARIIRDAYLKADIENRPRIFGMTASPVDAKCDLAEAAVQLETLLDSRIATTSDLTLLRNFVNKPMEVEWVYDKLPPPSETNLHSTLKTKYGDMLILEGVFRFASVASTELGGWCADQVWALALADEVLPKLEGSIGKVTDSDPRDSEKASEEIKRIQEASHLVNEYITDRAFMPSDLSPKLELLMGKLQEQFAKSPDTKCIVFTQRRNTAKVMLQLCEKLQIPNLRPEILVGVRKGDAIGMNSTFRRQFLVLAKFRKSEVNCLFATSVAEEGLDIPDCNLVVRFDLYDTFIQYVQSRGRARRADSVYATMVECGNRNHSMRLQEVRRAEHLMKNFCNLLPEDRKLYGDGHDMGVLVHEENRKRTYTVTRTGAMLTYRHAIGVLARFASSLQYENEISAKVTYVVMSENESFSCEVIMPEKSPVRRVLGCCESKKSLAKQSAAFDACLLLRKRNLLDEHFNSVYHKRLPAMRNAKLAITSKRTDQYKMRTKPSIWARQQGTIPIRLYAILIRLIPSEPLTRAHGSIVLLSREQITAIPTFPVFLDDDIETTVQSLCIDGCLEVASEELEIVTAFTLAVFHDVFHKTYKHVSEQFPYWLVPAREDIDVGMSTSLFDIIDWTALKYVQDNPKLVWSTDMEPESLLNRFIYDDWNGKYRYFPLAVDPNLRPSDPPPSYAPCRKWSDDIMNWSLSLSKNSRPKFFNRCIWTQPVLQAELVCLRRNFLDKMADEEKLSNSRCVICPQPLVLSTISKSVAATCFVFPAIITRMESYLIAEEGCKLLGLGGIKLEFALEALTKDSDNTEEHRSLQIHVQRGMGKNYERLELLGDSVLKMATSISLFVQNPDDDEYDYHVNRMCLICNKNLFKNATELKLYEFIRSRGFSRHMWYPPGLSLEYGRDHAKFVDSEGKHSLSEKTIADVCEALIGASLLSGGDDHRYDMAVKAVTVFVNSQKHTATSWKDYISAYSIPLYQKKAADGFEMNLAQQIFEKVGYEFKYPRLLRSAFTHPSYPLTWAKVPCYQRLEYLGDALLDMVCVEHLFHRFPTRDPQWLTEHKMAMVSNKFLGALAVKLGLHLHLQHFSNPLMIQNSKYAEELQLAESESNGEVNYWLSTSDSPKCLPDMLEAYLGAIFVDSSFDFTVIEAFFKRHILPFFHDMSIYDTFANRHPTTFLHSQMTHSYRCTEYCLKSAEVPTVEGETPCVFAAVMVHGQSIASAVASSSRSAKVRASTQALAVIDGMTLSEFQEKYHCACQGGQVSVDRANIGTAV
ncbi:Helicase, C-terminal [Penicillium digitatum]|uniref:Dicer-like protein 1 n=1 Tax=Penicillium digitatum TaxID=36651 RepID=A0A7T7BLI2_PENDI|nr:Helicase, C-terminal [Penicillium digitatum]